MALAGAFPWGRAALLPSCYFVSCTVDYTNYGSMVGIEPARASYRCRVTVLALSVARRVHNSTMATFSKRD